MGSLNYLWINFFKMSSQYHRNHMCDSRKGIWTLSHTHLPFAMFRQKFCAAARLNSVNALTVDNLRPHHREPWSASSLVFGVMEIPLFWPFRPVVVTITRHILSLLLNQPFSLSHRMRSDAQSTKVEVKVFTCTCLHLWANISLKVMGRNVFVS